jgi:hypothetical protein
MEQADASIQRYLGMLDTADRQDGDAAALRTGRLTTRAATACSIASSARISCRSSSIRVGCRQDALCTRRTARCRSRTWCLSA